MPKRVGYIIPEFPGQTHIWMWREIVWMRRWLGELHIYSTRRPPEKEWARHDFVKPAMEMTTFLWPGPVWTAMLWAMFCRPAGFLKCVGLCFTLPITQRPRFVQLLKLLPSACLLAHNATRRGITHLHSQSCANSAILGMMVKRLAGIPFSLTINANIEWWGGAMREKFSEAEFTMSHTKWVYADIMRKYPELKEGQAICGSIGVDTAAWTPTMRVPRPTETFRLITVGRLHESKGHDVLIDAVARLLREGRDISLRIIGEGPQRGELEKKAGELKVALKGSDPFLRAELKGSDPLLRADPLLRVDLVSRVQLLGSMAEHQVQAEMRSADAFVLASHAEPLGVAYMEAMAAGVPVIGTSAGGVGEIITHERDGLLVRPKDSDELARAIARLMDDAELCRRLAENARQTVVRRFDSRLGAATLYERITGEQPPGESELERRSA